MTKAEVRLAEHEHLFIAQHRVFPKLKKLMLRLKRELPWVTRDRFPGSFKRCEES